MAGVSRRHRRLYRKLAGFVCRFSAHDFAGVALTGACGKKLYAHLSIRVKPGGARRGPSRNIASQDIVGGLPGHWINQIRSSSRCPIRRRNPTRIAAAAMMTSTVSGFQGRVAMASTVPAAGGCSASVKAIASIKTPSDAARPASWARGVAVRRSATGETKNRKEQAVPMPRASRCPPHIERTDTYRLEGMDERYDYAGTKAGGQGGVGDGIGEHQDRQHDHRGYGSLG